MAIPENKAQLLTAINTEYCALLRQLNAVPLELVFQATMVGHAKNTTMSVANLLAYLIGWQSLVLKWHEQESLNLPIDFPETGYKWNQLGQLAQKFYRDYEHIDSYAQLLTLLEEKKTQIIALLETYSDQQLYGQTWYEQWTRGRMIQFNTASPYKNAALRLRKWRKTNLTT